MAGIDGVKNRIHPKDHNWGPYDFNMFEMPAEERKNIQGLPRSLGEALDALESDYEYLTAGDVFPKSLVDLWISLKRREERYVNQIPHPIEFVKYYDL
jgi:glutamine synthetase